MMPTRLSNDHRGFATGRGARPKGSVFVVNPSATTGQGPVWNGTKWVGQTAAVGLAGATPDLFGTVDITGVVDSTAALQAWAASGKFLSLTPGAIYLHRKQITFNVPGQRVNGNGAKLIRPAQAVTTTTTAITNGVTSAITVAATSGGSGATAWSIQPGDQIVVQQGAATNFDPSSRTVLSVVGLVVTITGTFGITLAGTINVYHGWQQTSVVASDVRISDLTIDGNSSNWTFARWQHTNGVAVGNSVACDNVMLDHCRVQNQPGDGVSYGAFGIHMRDCIVQNIKGRGVVFGGSQVQTNTTQAIVADNRFLNCNQDITVAGADGTASIDFSQGGPHVSAHGNYLDGGVDGIADLRTWQSSKSSMVDNTILNMTGWGINANGAAAGTTKNLTIALNRLYGCGLTVSSVGNASIPSNWRIIGNEIIGGQMVLNTVNDFTVMENELAPMRPPVTFTATPSAGGGAWAAGTWFAQITATNAAGETIGSEEITFTTTLNGTVSFAWTPVSNATGYKIYVASGSGGETGATQLLATVAATPGVYVSQEPTLVNTTGTLSAGSMPTVDSTFSAVTAMIAIGATGGSVKNLIVAHNRVTGGVWGIRTFGTGEPVQNVQVHDNLLKSQVSGGILVSQTTWTDFTVKGNTIVADAATANSYAGINTQAGEVSGNTIDVSGVGGATGTQGINVNTGTGIIVRGNTVICGGGTATSISITGTSTNAIVTGNILDKALSSAGVTPVRFGNQFTQGPRSGTITLNGTTAVVITTTEVQSAADVRYSRQTLSGAAGNITVGTTNAGANTRLVSDNAADLGVVNWWLDH